MEEVGGRFDLRVGRTIARNGDEIARYRHLVLSRRCAKQFSGQQRPGRWGFGFLRHSTTSSHAVPSRPVLPGRPASGGPAVTYQGDTKLRKRGRAVRERTEYRLSSA